MTSVCACVSTKNMSFLGPQVSLIIMTLRDTMDFQMASQNHDTKSAQPSSAQTVVPLLLYQRNRVSFECSPSSDMPRQKRHTGVAEIKQLCLGASELYGFCYQGNLTFWSSTLLTLWMCASSILLSKPWNIVKNVLNFLNKTKNKWISKVCANLWEPLKSCFCSEHCFSAKNSVGRAKLLMFIPSGARKYDKYVLITEGLKESKKTKHTQKWWDVVHHLWSTTSIVSNISCAAILFTFYFYTFFDPAHRYIMDMFISTFYLIT